MFDYIDTRGGALKLKVTNCVRLKDNSKIDLSGLGYHGGQPLSQGNSYQGSSLKSGRANYGGGGYKYIETSIFTTKAHGCGGGYGTKGNGKNCGQTYGDERLNQLYLGSGGGGSIECIGGNGGGSIRITCNKLIIAEGSSINCNGEDGNSKSIKDKISDMSGAGSGGSIHIVCDELSNRGHIIAIGGKAIFGLYNGSGGMGRIRIDSPNINNFGTINPSIGYNSIQPLK